MNYPIASRPSSPPRLSRVRFFVSGGRSPPALCVCPVRSGPVCLSSARRQAPPTTTYARAPTPTPSPGGVRHPELLLLPSPPSSAPPSRCTCRLVKRLNDLRQADFRAVAALKPFLVHVANHVSDGRAAEADAATLAAAEAALETAKKAEYEAADKAAAKDAVTAAEAALEKAKQLIDEQRLKYLLRRTSGQARGVLAPTAHTAHPHS